MVYEILMPQLSDSMDEGKLISWKVSVNDTVHMGDVIAEVESDKAIMEVQCFKNGVVKALYIKEGESAPVGTVIAGIELESEIVSVVKEQVEQKEQEKQEEKPESTKIEVDKDVQVLQEQYSLSKAAASPKARVLAKKYNIDIQSLQEQKKLPSPAHEKDISTYHKKRFFTPKALKLMELHNLDEKEFDLRKKHDSKDVLEYVKTDKPSEPKEISGFQKALIKNLDKSAKKAVYHIYDYINNSYFYKYSSYGLSAWLIKIFAKGMMEFDGFRLSLKDEHILCLNSACISIAMQEDKKLYMPVIKDADILNIKQIQERLSRYKTEIKESALTLEQMQGSSFGISNLGMTGVHRFDAMINQDDSAIAAIGASQDGKISVTLTLDHRLINGYEAALFMQRVKEICLDEEFFKEALREAENV